jgi:hypothetical protein
MRYSRRMFRILTSPQLTLVAKSATIALPSRYSAWFTTRHTADRCRPLVAHKFLPHLFHHGRWWG